MERTSASGEQERHNVTVITVGSKCYSLCSVSSSLSHATLEQPFRTFTNNVRGKNIVKEVFLRLPSCVVYLASVIHCVGMYPAYISSIYICIFLHVHAYNLTTFSFNNSHLFPHSYVFFNFFSSSCSSYVLYQRICS